MTTRITSGSAVSSRHPKPARPPGAKAGRSPCPTKQKRLVDLIRGTVLLPVDVGEGVVGSNYHRSLLRAIDLAAPPNVACFYQRRLSQFSDAT